MQRGTTNTQIRKQNLGLVLRQVATNNGISRVDIATRTKLTKTTISNVVLTLIQNRLVEETPIGLEGTAQTLLSGRPAIQLGISANAPLVCGMLLKRKQTVVLLGTLAGEIVDEICENHSSPIDPDYLIQFLLDSYKLLRNRHKGSIMGVGISCVGLIDITEGIILNPPRYFSSPCELPIIQLLKDKISEPLFLMHDTSASILAEQLYSNQVLPPNFAYITFQTGIGIGLVLNGQVYNGIMGQSGELGHCSIDHNGETCVCGNKGCLELYANSQKMVEQLQKYQEVGFPHPILSKENPRFIDFIQYANQGDGASLSILMEFSEYVATALVSVINLLDLDLIVIEYDGAETGKRVLEDLLESRINQKMLGSKYKRVAVRQSRFGAQLSRVSTIGIVAQHVFNGELGLPST